MIPQRPYLESDIEVRPGAPEHPGNPEVPSWPTLIKDTMWIRGDEK